MGLNTSNLQGILFALKHGVSLENTATIGRMNNNLKLKAKMRLKLIKLLIEYNPKGNLSAIDAQYADELFAFLGAQRIDSVDISDYQGATIIHDMNCPIDLEYHNKYTCVFDLGCLEHIFNYPVAIKSCMDMVKVNGHIILQTPANNQFGHGFYQFSPELFFSLLCEHNGYSDTRIFTQDDKKRWYEVTSPTVTKRRVDICRPDKKPSSLFVVSRKIDKVPDILNVQQSDYLNMWDEKSKEASVAYRRKKQGLNIMRKLIPSPIYAFFRNIKVLYRLVSRITSSRSRQLLKEFYTQTKKLDF